MFVIVTLPNGSFSGNLDWGYSDWLGLGVFLFVLTFLLAVGVALLKGESPLKIIKLIGSPLTAILKLKKPN
jgi:hypothetical protein